MILISNRMIYLTTKVTKKIQKIFVPKDLQAALVTLAFSTIYFALFYV